MTIQLVPRSGQFEVTKVGEEFVRSFMPNPLPPDPPLVLSDADQHLLERATVALGRLDGMTPLLPDPNLFIYFYIRKEAVLSSQIEGTQSSLSDLLMYESSQHTGVPIDDVQEVARYVAAMNLGLQLVREDWPLSLRLVRDVHKVLLKSSRGADKEPGEFRRTQNWVGGQRPGNARYVPPPPHRVMEAMGSLEKFLNPPPESQSMPTLLRAAMAHVQFETIHPFLDGNGRLGRLLVTLLLCADKILKEPTLYLSLYFRANRDEYYERLQRVRTDAAWEDWVRFFLRGVLETSEQAVATATKIRDLFSADRARIQEAAGRKAPTVLRAHEHMQRKPFFTIPQASEAVNLAQPTVASAIRILTQLEMVKEIGDKKRDRMYMYAPYVAILSDG